MRNSPVCVDANLSIKLVIAEDDSDLALALWEQWTAEQQRVIAPTLWAYEVTSVLRNRVHRRLLPWEQAEGAFEAVHELPVELLQPEALHRRAWDIAHRFGRPAAYDSHYLALADLFACPFWTADERLFRAVEGELDWVHWLGDYQPPAAP